MINAVTNTEQLMLGPELVQCVTVGTGPAELYAGASRLIKRRGMAIYNEGTVTIYIRVGGVPVAGITGAAWPIVAGDYAILAFDPADQVGIAVNAIAASANANIKVREW